MSASTTTVRSKRSQRQSSVSAVENNANSEPKRRYDAAAGADPAADNEVVDKAVADAAEAELNNLVAAEPAENNVVVSNNAQQDENCATQKSNEEKKRKLFVLKCNIVVNFFFFI
jgi:hypothetical protein